VGTVRGLAVPAWRAARWTAAAAARRPHAAGAVVDEAYDQAADLLGDGYHIVHQTVGLVGDGRHHGASVASRWPIRRVYEVDLHLTPRTGDYSCGTVIAEVLAPERLGRLLMVSHGPSWPWWSEVEREPPTGTAGGACTATTPDGPLTRATH
jgi:hypothetical protein